MLTPERTVGNQRRYTDRDILALKKKPKWMGIEKSKTIVAAKTEKIGEIELVNGFKKTRIINTSGHDLEGFDDLMQNMLGSNPVSKTPRGFFQTLAGAQKALVFGSLLVFLAVGSVLAARQVVFPSTPEFFSEESDQFVLAASSSNDSDFVFNLNVPATFFENVTLEKDLTVKGKAVFENLTATGTVTAPNLLYGVVAGDGVSVGTGQNPTIANTGVLSIGGKTGSVSLSAGSGISVSGVTLTNSDLGSSQNIFKTITDGTTSFAAGSNTDTLTFAANSGLSLSVDTTNKKLTFSGTSSTTAWTLNSTSLYPSSTTYSVGIGTTSPGKTLDVAGTGAFSSLLTLTGVPSSSGVNTGSLYINPATSTADYTLFGVAVGGVEKLRIDAEGDIHIQGSIISTTPGTVGYWSRTSTNTYLGNSGDLVGIGTSAPASKLGVVGNLSVGATYGTVAAPTSGLIVEGNVGIGTTTPALLLDLASGGDLGIGGSRVFSIDGTRNLIAGAGAGAVLEAGGTDNTLLGYNAGTALTTGDQNVFIGAEAGDAVTTVSGLTAVGYQALYSNTTGTLNTALGYQSLYSNTTGYSNVANGYQALYSNIIGVGSIAIGESALYSNNAHHNIALGYHTMYSNTTGYSNIAMGDRALSTNISGYANVALGDHALFSNTSGLVNTAVGASALYRNTTANANVALGESAGYYNTTGAANIFLGDQSGDTATATTSNQFIAGSSNYPINNVYFGKGVINAVPTAYTINGTGGSGTNIIGGNLQLAGGIGTGTGLGGAITFSTTPAGSTGATANTLAEIMRITPGGNVGIGTTTPAAKLDLYTDPTTGNGMLITANNLTSGNALKITTSSAGYPTSGGLLNVSAIQDYGASSTYSGNVATISRSASIQPGGATLNVTGSVLAVTDNCRLLAAATCTHSGNVLSLTQSWASATGTVLAVTNSGTGAAATFNSGNVGIGTTSPGAKLEVGDGTDSLQVSSVGDLTFVDADGAASITGPAGGALTISGGSGQALNLDSGTTGAVNIGTGANAKTVTIGNNTGATALAFTSGTGSQTFTSSVATTATTSSAWVFTGASLTTGTGAYLNANALTSGKLMDLSSTSTTLTTGNLFNMDWSPGSVQTTAATGNLFNINIGANASNFAGNLFNVGDTGSSIFSISKSAVTTSLPMSLTAPGDLSVSYDINMTNPTSSFVKSSSALTLQAGEVYNSADLTLKTYNQGSVVVDSAVTTGTGVDFTNNTVTTGTGLYIAANALTTGNAANIVSTSTAGGASGSSYLLNLSRSGANANLAHTAYGVYSAVTNTNATSGTNTAAYLSASGATTANYALYSAAGQNYFASNGAVSTPVMTLAGTWYTGGSATTTKPQLLIEPTGTTSTTWNTSGTGLGINTTSTSGLLADFQSASTSRFAIGANGNLVLGSGSQITIGSQVYSANTISMGSNATLTFTDGSPLFSLTPIVANNTATDINVVKAGGYTKTITGSYATQRFTLFSQSTITAASALNISSEASTLSISGAPISAGSATIANAYGLKIDSGTSVAAGVTNAYGLYVAAPTGATNNYAATFATGNVGIGTTAPSLRLDVQDSQAATGAAQIYNTNIGTDADGLVIKLGNTSTTAVAASNHFLSFETFGIGIVGSVQGNGAKGVSYATSGIADFAEYLKKDRNETIPFGSVVCLASNGNVTQCSSAQNKIVGVASEHPTFVGGENLGEGSIAVGMVGQVVTRVSITNGAIKPGDYITASSTPGVAVKATKAGQVIGRALEALPCPQTTDYGLQTAVDSRPLTVDKSCEGKILVLVQPTWHDPTVYIGMDGNISVPAVSALAAIPIGNPQLESQTSVIASTSAVIPAQVIDSEISIAQTRRAGIQIPDQVQDDIASLSARLAFVESIQQSQVLGASTSASLSGMTDLLTNNATVSGMLNVTGRTTVADLGVTGNIIAGVMSIHGLDGEINTLAGDLKLQSNGLNGIDLLAGKVKIDTSGNIVTQGTISVKKILVDISDSDTATLGSAKVQKGNTVITIYTQAVTAKSKIFITPKRPVAIGVSKQTAGTGFTVELEKANSQDVEFDWWIVDTRD